MDVVCLDRLGVEDALADALHLVVVEAVEVHPAAGDLTAEDQQVDIPYPRLSLVRVVLGGALDSRHPADRGADLGVAGHRGLHRHRLPTRGQRRPGRLDELVVLVAVAPPAAVDVDPGRLPGREYVVLRMPVQIDQTRQDQSFGADRMLNVARLSRADRHDLTRLHHHPATSNRPITLQHRPTERRRLPRTRPPRYQAPRQSRAGIQRHVTHTGDRRPRWTANSASHPTPIRLIERVSPCHRLSLIHISEPTRRTPISY